MKFKLYEVLLIFNIIEWVKIRKIKGKKRWHLV